MREDISLAWAVGVDFPRLGARLEAYVETKAAITTFAACKSVSNIPSMTALPVEVLTMIHDALTDMVYLEKLHEWHRAQRCLQGECHARDHSTSKESNEYVDFCARFGRHKDFVMKFQEYFSTKSRGKFVIC